MWPTLARSVERWARVRGPQKGLQLIYAHEFTAIIERDDEWFIAYCPEIPGTNGQGRTKAEARESLSQAISLILEDRGEDARYSQPSRV